MADAPPVQFACYKCRRILFSSTALLTHTPGYVTPSTFAGKKPTNSSVSSAGCSSYFVDPDELAVGAFVGNEGKLFCPHCSSKLGSFTWSGDQCSCGVWVVPAFMFSRSRVDEKGTGRRGGGVAAAAAVAPVIVFRPKLEQAETDSSAAPPSQADGNEAAAAHSGDG